MLKLQFRDRRQEPVWLADETFTIGRNGNNSLVINAPEISDKHAEISQLNGSLTIRDIGSLGGTFVNDQKIDDSATLKAGDVIKLGNVELEVIKPHPGVGEETPTALHNAESEWKVVATASWMNSQQFDIQGTMVIGRESTCEINIPVEYLSRRHAELSIQGGKLVVRDLESANGTYVNGRRVTEATLQDGDKLKFDVLTFTVKGPQHDPNKTIIRQVKDFKPQLEQARQEQARKKAQTQQPAPPPADPAAATVSRSGTARQTPESRSSSWETQTAPQHKSNNTMLMALAVVVIGAALAGIAYVLLP